MPTSFPTSLARVAFAALLAAALAACGGDPQTVDPCTRITCPEATVCQAGACVPDGTGPIGGGGNDGGTSGNDGGTTDGGTEDGGTDEDGGMTGDAGSDEDGGVEEDGGMTSDAGTDAGMGQDAGSNPTASAQIAAARAAPNDAGVLLPITGAVVTYLKPAVGNEGAGFTIQGEPSGPALFVNVDPQTLTPPPSVGDAVSFTIEEMGTLGGNTVRMVSALDEASWARVSSGTPVSGFVQDLSSSNTVVSNVSDFESELVRVSATISGSFSSAGTGHLKAPITTTGYPTGDALLRLRVPTTLRDAADLVPGCNVTVQGTPLWRLGTEVQVSAWTGADVQVSQCPAPTLVSASSTSSTQVQLTFDRQISAASLASPFAFTFSGGLLATGATSNGRVVTVNTSQQTSGTTYTVTVGMGVTDTTGTAVSTTANSATFTGFSQPAILQLNEINPRMTGGRDLIELRAITGGSMNGIRLEQIGTSTVTVLATMPDVVVAAGDLVVVHVSSGTLPTETTSKAQFPKSATPENYDGAWDVHSGSGGMSDAANRVIRVVSSTSGFMHAVPFIAPAGVESATFSAEFHALVAAGNWVLTTPCAAGPTACTLAEIRLNSVDWQTGVTASDTSSNYRLAGANTKTRNDWGKASAATVPATFGAPNP